MKCEPCDGEGVGIESDGLVHAMVAGACPFCGGSGAIDPDNDTSIAAWRRDRAARAYRKLDLIP